MILIDDERAQILSYNARPEIETAASEHTDEVLSRGYSTVPPVLSPKLAASAENVRPIRSNVHNAGLVDP